MRGVVLLLACAVVAAALPGSGQAQALCNDGDVPDLQACRAVARDAASAYMSGQDAGVFHLEVAAAVQADPAAWPSPQAPAWGGISIPAAQGAINEAEIRPYHAAASLGLDMHAFPDPDRGIIDLVQEAQALHGGVMATNYPALLAWHLWNLHAFGDAADGALVEEAATRLQALQRPEGGWACSSPAFVSPDCGAWAAMALAMHGRLDGISLQRALTYFEAGYDSITGGYSDQGTVGVNAMTTALIIGVYRAGGLPDEVRDETWAYLLSLQAETGGFQLRAGADPSAWTTRTVVTALASHYPLPRSASVDVLPAVLHVGEAESYVAGPFTDALWRCGQATWTGLERMAFLETLDPASCRVHATGDGVHGWTDYAPVIRNDPPTLADLGGTLTTDRVAGIALDPAATDPEGFPVEVAWTLGPLGGSGVVDRLPAQPGRYTLGLTARDPHGGVATASVEVLIQNLAPVIDDRELPASARPGEDVAFRVEAHDPDGDALTYTWTFASQGHAREVDGTGGTVALPEGSYTVLVHVQDAHGVAASWSGSMTVLDDAPVTVAPELTLAEAGIEGRSVTVHVKASPAGAEAWAWWQAGDQVVDIPLTGGHGRVQVPDDVETIHEIRVGARHDGLEVERSWGPFVLEPIHQEPPAAEAEEDTDEASWAAGAVATESQAPPVTSQEAPLGLLVPMVSLAAALGMRGRPARRPGRTGRR